MKTKIKKRLEMVMSLVVLMGECTAGVACDTNKETEAEYKARIKKELDEIPIEASGYKLVDPTKQEVTYPEGEEPVRNTRKLVIDGHEYTFIYEYENELDDESRRQWWHKIIVSVDGKGHKPITFSDNKFFDYYSGQLFVYYYDKNFFIVRYRASSSWLLAYSGFYPPILFLYDIEQNVAKYIGYSEAWFDYKIKDLDGNGSENHSFTIIKI